MAENITYDWYYDSREKKISSVIKNYNEREKNLALCCDFIINETVYKR